MFVRFRQTRARLQASLVETRRIDGKVRQEHVAMLGTCDVPPSVAVRLVFWQSLHERLARLGNRLDAATQAKLLGDIHARIPMVTPHEQRALQIANAKADAETWDKLADLHAGTASDHERLIAKAEATRANIAAEQSRAAALAARAKDRMARIERGEDVAGGLGKPVVFDEQFLLEGGFTKTDIERLQQVNEVSDAIGFDTMAKAIHEAKERAERSTVRALHRRIPNKPGDN